MGVEMVRDEGVVECESAKQSQTKCVFVSKTGGIVGLVLC